nr:MAG: coat protein [Virgaviridae-like virus 5]
MAYTREQMEAAIKERLSEVTAQSDRYRKELDEVRKTLSEGGPQATEILDLKRRFKKAEAALIESEAKHSGLRDDYTSLVSDLTAERAKAVNYRNERDRLEIEVRKLQADLKSLRFEFSQFRSSTRLDSGNDIPTLPMAGLSSTPGQYLNWNRTADIMSTDNFVSFRDMLSLLRSLRATNFWVHTARETAITAVHSQNVSSPFSMHIRFPSDGIYINITDGAIAALLVIITDALSFGERAIEATSDKNAGRSYGSQNDAKVAFSKSVSRIHEMLRQSDPILLPTYGIFDQHSLESFLRINWTSS